GMEHFVSKIPNADYRIGVILAHGTGPYHGQLYGGPGPKVLDYREYLRRTGSREAAAKAIAEALERKLTNPPNEKFDKKFRGKYDGAGGESLLFSLYTAITDNKEILSRDGLYSLMDRDAALAVIFMTDEQDVCFDYASYLAKPDGEKYKPALKLYPGTEKP